MKLLIIQPKLEKSLDQLENELQKHPAVDIVIFPEGYLNENVERACQLAQKHNTVLIGGYRKPLERPKDRALIINRQGEVVLDRVKYSSTSFVIVDGLKIGHILCDELIKQGLTGVNDGDIDLIVHPIGVGMFSEEQFEEWINEAQRLAIANHTLIIGTSHADGSFGDTGVSIPIAYAIDKNGEAAFISNNDVRARILHLETREVSFL